MDSLIALMTFVMLTSVAAERFTEILKKAILQRQTLFNPTAAVYQTVSAVFGGVMTYMSPPDLSAIHLSLPPYLTAIIVGLAVSGGSGLWSDLLSLLTDYRKNIVSGK